MGKRPQIQKKPAAPSVPPQHLYFVPVRGKAGITQCFVAIANGNVYTLAETPQLDRAINRTAAKSAYRLTVQKIR